MKAIIGTDIEHAFSFLKKEKLVAIPTEPVLDGSYCSLGLESTIVEFSNEKPVMHRFRAISTEEIYKELEN